MAGKGHSLPVRRPGSQHGELSQETSRLVRNKETDKEVALELRQRSRQGLDLGGSGQTT